MEGNCAICTISYSSDQNISVTFCGHVFHGECISRWLRDCGPRKTCPQCRAQLNDSQVVPKIYMNVNKQQNKLNACELKKDLQQCQSLVGKLVLENHKLEDCLETRTKERDALKKERDVLIKERDVLKKDMDVLKKEKDLMKKDRDVLKKAYENLRFKWNNRESVGEKYAIMLTLTQGLLKMVAQEHGLPVDFLDQSDLATSLNPPSYSQAVKVLRKAKATPSHSEKRTSTTAGLVGQESPAPATSQASKRKMKLRDGTTKTSPKRPRLLSPASNSSKA